MIEWIIGFLVAKWWTEKEENKEREQVQEFSGNIEYTISYGYVRNDETIQDLQ